MKSVTRRLSLLFVIFVSFTLVVVQAQMAAQSPAVPRLVSFSGKAVDAQGKPVFGPAGATFAIYKDPSGGTPLWIETQNVAADAKGNYTAQLGATKSEGLPLDLFTSGEARWLGVRVNGGEEQPRVMLLSVPYALKAGDAATLGGMPLSAFVLAAPTGGAQPAAANSNVGSAANPVNPSVTGTGTVGSIPLWDSASDITSSILTQLGSGSTARLGVNFAVPSATLDVKGTSNFRGTTTLLASGLATASAGKTSYPFVFASAAFNSSTSASVLQDFRWQAEPAGNNTASPSATLNLLFSSAPAAPAETGFRIASNGQISFASGQVFPGTGTITGVTAGKGLTGGGATGGVTLNLDTTKVPLLAAANTFTGNQTVNGNLTSTGIVTGSGYQIGSNLFAFGSYNSGNSFSGFSGNSTTTGTYNTANGLTSLSSITNGTFNAVNGALSLFSNTSGSYNVANGGQVLYSNTTGNFNTANGALALHNNLSGGNNVATGFSALFSNLVSYNTADGADALYNNDGGHDNTATGYRALYSQFGGDGQSVIASLNTADGSEALYNNVDGFANTAVGYQALFANVGNQLTQTGDDNTASGYQAVYSNTYGVGNTGLGSGALRQSATGNDNTAVGIGAMPNLTTGSYNTCIGAGCDVGNVTYSTAIGAGAVVSTAHAIVLGGTGYYHVNVGIGTTSPTNVFTIGQGAGNAIADGWDTYSSRRWKTNIHTLPNALAKVEQLRGVTYDLKDSGKHEIGVIAEEVGAVVPEVVTYEENGKDARGVDYSRLTALLIEATKQQQSLLRAQQAAIYQLKSQLRATQAGLRKVQAQLNAGQHRVVLAAK